MRAAVEATASEDYTRPGMDGKRIHSKPVATILSAKNRQPLSRLAAIPGTIPRNGDATGKFKTRRDR